MSDDPTPLTTCYELVKNENFVNQFPNLYFSIGASDKGDDPKRIKGFVDYFNKNPNLTKANVREHPPARAHLVDGQPASASRLRKAFADEEWETFKKLLPNESFYDDVVQILNNQGVGRVNENFLLAVPQSFLVEGKEQIAAKTELIKEEVADEQEAAVRERIAMLMKNVLSEVGLDLLDFSDDGEKIKDGILGTLIDSVTDQLVGAEEELQDGKKEISEMSMAAGNVGGFGAPIHPVVGEEDE